MQYKIKQIAEITGISERMLRHYDRIGLLKPDCVTAAGYRLYSDQNLDRLLHILFFKELDFDLSEIKRILDSPYYDKRKALEVQERLLEKRKERLGAVIRAIRKTIDNLENPDFMDKREIFTVFDMAEIKRNKEKYALEFKLKLGGTLTDECGVKTDLYTQEDWSIVMSKAGEIFDELCSYIDESPSHPIVQKKIGELKEFITNSFWTCNNDVFRTLGDLYVKDETFRQYVEQYHKKLPEFISEAINTYCG